MKQKRYLCAFFLSFFLIFNAPNVCFSQEEAQEVKTQEEAPVVKDEKSIFSISFDDIKNASELTPIAVLISNEHAKVLEEISNYDDFLTKIKDDLKNKEEAFNTLKNSYDEAVSSKYTNQEKVSELAGQINELSERTEELAKTCSSKTSKISLLKEKWEEVRVKWREQKQNFAKDYDLLKDTFKKVDNDIKDAILGLDKAKKPLLETQNEIIKFQSQINDVKKTINKNLSGFAKDTFKKNTASFFAADFWSDFNNDLHKDFKDSFNLMADFSKGNLSSNHILVFVIHIIFLFALYFGLRRIRKKGFKDENIKYILLLPFSVSLFISTVVMGGFYGFDLGNFFKIFLLLIATLSGAFIIKQVLKDKQKIIFLFSLIIIFTIQRIFSLINIPEPINRMFISIASLVLFILLNYKTRFFDFLNLKNVLYTSFDRFICNITLIATFAFQIAGYNLLSFSIFDIFVRLLFCIALSWILTTLFRELVYVIFHFTLVSRIKIFKNHSGYILKRINILIAFVIYFLTFCYVMSSFSFFNSTDEALKYFLGLGVTLAGTKLTFGLVLVAIVLFFAIMFVSWFIQRILEEEVYPRKGVQIGVQASINRILYYSFFCIGVLLCLSVLGFELKNIAVAFGVLGVGIGFGLQNFVNNFVSGLTLLFERPIKIGDCVDVNGQMGIVKKMGLRATVVETTLKSEVIVPNSEIISSKVTNWTYSERKFAIILGVGVSYGSDVNKVTQILKEIAETQEGVFKTPTPLIVFKEFGDSSLNYTLRIYTTFADMNRVRHEINTRIFNRFKEEGIEIPFPQRDVNLVGIKDIIKDVIKDNKKE